MQALEVAEQSTVIRTVLTPKTLAKLNALGYDACHHCGQLFIVGMEVARKARVKSPKYCGNCADVLGL